MKDATAFIAALSSFAWPLLVAAALFFTRDRIGEVATAAIVRLKGATDIEVGFLKLKGAPVVSVGGAVIRESALLRTRNASTAFRRQRSELYDAQKSLMLVHTIRPADGVPDIEADGRKYRVFDVSIFLQPHRDWGRLNDIKSVSYYLGQQWGTGENGSVYVIENGNNGFAFTARMFGACLCFATLEFHDGSSVVASRYLDVEMAPVFGIALADAR